MAKLGPLVRVKTIESLEGFLVRVEFEDGTQKLLDLQTYLRGPIFEPIRNDPIMFRSMKVWDGTITWDNGADIDSDVLYYDDLKPAWMGSQREGSRLKNWPNPVMQPKRYASRAADGDHSAAARGVVVSCNTWRTDVKHLQLEVHFTDMKGYFMAETKDSQLWERKFRSRGSLRLQFVSTL